MKIKVFFLIVLIIFGIFCGEFMYINCNDKSFLPESPNNTELSDFKEASNKIKMFEDECEKIQSLVDYTNKEDIDKAIEKIDNLKDYAKENILYLNLHTDDIETCFDFYELCSNLELGEEYVQSESEKEINFEDEINSLNDYYNDVIEKYAALCEFCIDLNLDYENGLTDTLSFDLNTVQFEHDLAQIKILQYSDEYNIMEVNYIPEAYEYIITKLQDKAEKEATLAIYQKYLLIALIIDTIFISILIVLIIRGKKRQKTNKPITLIE